MSAVRNDIHWLLHHMSIFNDILAFSYIYIFAYRAKFSSRTPSIYEKLIKKRVYINKIRGKNRNCRPEVTRCCAMDLKIGIHGLQTNTPRHFSRISKYRPSFSKNRSSKSRGNCCRCQPYSKGGGLKSKVTLDRPKSQHFGQNHFLKCGNRLQNHLILVSKSLLSSANIIFRSCPSI